MLHYYINDTAVAIELLVTNNQDPITSLAPTVCIRDKDTSGTYYDFATNIFQTTPTSATAVLLSGTAGVYGFRWDVSGKITTSMQLTFEYRWGTAAATDDVIFTRPPLSTADIAGAASVGGGGSFGGSQVIKIDGIMTDVEKLKMFDQLDRIEEDTREFRQQSIAILRGLLAKKVVTKEDLDDVLALKERDLEFFQNLVCVLDLYEDVTEDKLFKALNEYIVNKEEKLEKLVEKMNRLVSKKEEPKEEWLDDDD